MRTRTIVTIVLLVFVGASVGYLVISEARTGSPTAQENPAPAVSAPAAAPANVPPVAAAPADEPPAHKLIAYYFHRTQRCKTCLTIERYAKEALEGSFPEAFESGQLEWQAINVEEPAHEHFVTDYELTSSALVLVNTRGGKPAEWRNLEQVWELVGDELKFKAYVAAEAMALQENDR